MKATNEYMDGRRLGYSPYDVAPEQSGAGMSAVEMLLSLYIMAALSIGMIWLLSTCKH